MQGPLKTPTLLAAALLRGPVTPERIQKLLWHAKKGTRVEFTQTLAAIPDPAVRQQVEQMLVATTFRG